MISKCSAGKSCAAIAARQRLSSSKRRYVGMTTEIAMPASPSAGGSLAGEPV